jgi:hypothetical protein
MFISVQKCYGCGVVDNEGEAAGSPMDGWLTSMLLFDVMETGYI